MVSEHCMTSDEGPLFERGSRYAVLVTQNDDKLSTEPETHHWAVLPAEELNLLERIFA